MKNESAIDILNRDILLLEEKRILELKNLKEQFYLISESLKPINLIKSTFQDATHSPEIKDGLGKAAIGMASGFLLKKLVFGSSINPLKKFAGMAFQAIITNVAANNSDKIKNAGLGIFDMVKYLIKPKKKLIVDDSDESYDFGEK